MLNPNQAQFGGSFQQTPPQRKGCWGRHWKWMLPLGCLGLILGLAALVGGVVYVALSAVKSSEVYQGALRIAQASPAAVERLGEPIKDGWFVKGNVRYEGGAGNASFAAPLSGPKGSGTLHVLADTGGGEWVYRKLDLTVEGGETVSLLERGMGDSPPGSTVDVEEDADDAAAEEGGGGSTVPGSDGDAVPYGVLNEKAIHKPQPAYPPLAKAAGAAGIVTVRVTVDETGRVVSAEGLSGHPLLQQAAVQAARGARFAPTLLNGEPVKIDGLLIYTFVPE